MLCIYDLFQILPFLLHSYGSMECTYACVCMCVCVCVCVCVFVCRNVHMQIFMIRWCPRMSLCRILWYLLTVCLLLYQLLHLWRLPFHSPLIFQHPWQKMNRLQKRHRQGPMMALNQQLKEISKRNTLLISCAVQVQE